MATFTDNLQTYNQGPNATGPEFVAQQPQMPQYPDAAFSPAPDFQRNPDMVSAATANAMDLAQGVDTYRVPPSREVAEYAARQGESPVVAPEAVYETDATARQEIANAGPWVTHFRSQLLTEAQQAA